jgi:2-(1,2-epoxy-1,2-dihydrophenyl)acetyl-CoA isomerase
VPVYNAILFEVDGPVATLTLNRPDCLNALNFEMGEDIQQAMQLVEHDSSIRALVLTGAGRGFCSGQDLGDRAPPDSDIVEIYTKAYFAVLACIRASRVPVVMAINGSAAGGGFSLVLCGDLLLAAQSAEFVQEPSRIGIAPDLDSSYLLPSAIGRARSLEMMMANEPVSAEQALQWGMINECLDDEQLMPRARELASTLAKGPTRALAMTRQLVDESEGNDFEAQYRRELEVNRELRDCFDGKEGVQAFLEKRAARFRGE